MLTARPCKVNIPGGAAQTSRSFPDCHVCNTASAACFSRHSFKLSKLKWNLCSDPECHLHNLSFKAFASRQSFKLSKYKLKFAPVLNSRRGPLLRKGYQQRLRPVHASLNESSGLSANSSASPFTSSDNDLEETRYKLNASLHRSDTQIDYAQALHEAARKFQLAMEQHGLAQKNGLFSKSWLGVDHASWIKPLAYQAAVHALLQAVLDIASRGDGGDRDTHVFVQRSISRQLAPLEDSINEQFRARKSNAEKWFWSEQHPLTVTSFVELLESDSRFTTVTSVGWEGVSVCPSKASDVSLITLALNSSGAVMKLGSARLSCPIWFSTLNDEIARLMNVFVEFLPIDQVYNFTSSVGLRSQFFENFGSRAVQYRDSGELAGEEGAFWIDVVQQLLRGAIVREHIRRKLTSYDSIEVLERDLAVFGFFAALGRRTQKFLSENGSVESDDRIAGLLRYLIGGCTLFYPQLSSLNTYQFFIEVVSEEMDWLPFYPVSLSVEQVFHKQNEPSNSLNSEAIVKALDQCSRWINDFLKYSTWVQQPSGARAKAFLLKSKARLDNCIQAYPMEMALSKGCQTDPDLYSFSVEGSEHDGTREGQDTGIVVANNTIFKSEAHIRSQEFLKRTREELIELEASENVDQLKLFDEELQGVDEALRRLECLLLEQQGPGKENITAACTKLKTIRQLKKEVESLEASLRERASFAVQFDKSASQRYKKQKSKREKDFLNSDRESLKQQEKTRNPTSDTSTLEGEGFDQATALGLQEASTIPNEIQQFEALRQELMDLERCIQNSATDILSKQENECQTDFDHESGNLIAQHGRSKGAVQEDIVSDSLQKLRDTSADVWKGTQLLATDVVAAMVLIQRSASGEELTEKEKKSLKRTLTDLASIIPIGFLMLLPVTAIGHAAILAAIQRYAPALIPSAYAHERLQLVKQLEKVKEMESAEFEDVVCASDIHTDGRE
ncbi:hypothetical protein KP509_02G026100 [Ceratopteris richardii]|uniref:LETM1-like protein n=1 Tax=Ceratopteris richardii TaxID=49495 RepID=A0A8T2VBR7_CERRI|nr:hypothetical protein KP509_02G026100 [Ceratopteris richardii]